MTESRLAPARTSRIATRLTRVALGTTWCFVLPFVCAGAVYLAWVPRLDEVPSDSALFALARANASSPAGVAVAIFLGFAALFRYWMPHVPGVRALLDGSEARVLAKPESALREALGAALAIGVAACFAFAFRHAGYVPYRVSTSSMLPSLDPGTTVLGERFGYGVSLGVARIFESTPSRGDVVVFENESGVGPRGPMVKRVIGLPGDRVSMHAGIPVLDGVEVPSCDAGTYVLLAPGLEVRARLLVEALGGRRYLTVHAPFDAPFEGTYVLKPGEVFVLGDNRNASLDSRAWNGGKGGGLRLGAILARARHVLAGRDVGEPPSLSRLFDRIGSDFELRGVDRTELDRGIARCNAELSTTQGHGVLARHPNGARGR